MQQLLWESQFLNVKQPAAFPVFLRIKGLVALGGDDDSSKKYVVQAVQELYDIQMGAEWKDEVKMNKMVFIGRGLDRDLLLESFTKSVFG